MNEIGQALNAFYENNILAYINMYKQSPSKLISLIIDIALVILLIYLFVRMVKGTRTWQLVKGIAFLIIGTWISGILGLNILHYILGAIMNWGVILIIVIFQPEIRRALEQIGTNKITKFFGMEKDIATKTKEDIYKIVIAATELAKTRTGALIVIERDIDISKELGTRDRAAIGISKESDAIAVVVSEETGKISVAKDGTLIADVREDVLKKILISNVVTKRFSEKDNVINERFSKIKGIFKKKEKVINNNISNDK